jgi:hypothetical protein
MSSATSVPAGAQPLLDDAELLPQLVVAFAKRERMEVGRRQVGVAQRLFQLFTVLAFGVFGSEHLDFNGMQKPGERSADIRRDLAVDVFGRHRLVIPVPEGVILPGAEEADEAGALARGFTHGRLLPPINAIRP